MGISNNYKFILAASIVFSACGDSGESPAATVELTENWTEDGCLENVFEDPTKTDYIVRRKDMQIRADLCIKPGVRIAFDAETSWEIFEEGSLNAVGSAEEPIVMEGMNAESGTWGPISFSSESPKNVLEHVAISGSGFKEYSGFGGGLYASIVVGSISADVAVLAVRNSSIKSGIGSGIHNFGTLSELSNTTISGVADAPIESILVGLPDLSQSNTFEMNGKNAILISGKSKVSKDFTISAAPNPYEIGSGLNTDDFVGLLEISAKWTIKAGTVLNFETGTGIVVVDEGVLSVEGSETERVTFQKSPDATEWGGIAIISNLANNIDFALIKNTGGEFPSGGNGVNPRDDLRASIYVGNFTNVVGKVNVTNSNFEENEGSIFYQFTDSTIEEMDNEFNGAEAIVLH